MPSSSNSLRAFFGPRPGSQVISIRPGGNFFLSFSALGMEPVSSSTSSFSASVFPTPGSSVARPSRTSCSTLTGEFLIAAAAVR